MSSASAGKHEAGAHGLVIGGTPGHDGGERGIGAPADGGDETGQPGLGDAPHNPRQKQEVCHHGGESHDSERQVIHAEERFEEQEKTAFAPRPDGALRGGFEQHAEQVAGIIELANQAEPGEIVVDKPAAETVLKQPYEEDRGQGPEQQIRRPGFPFHLLSRPTEVAMTPSSRWSIAPAGRDLSRAKSTVTESFVRTSAGTSAVKV